LLLLRIKGSKPSQTKNLFYRVLAQLFARLQLIRLYFQRWSALFDQHSQVVHKMEFGHHDHQRRQKTRQKGFFSSIFK
jgi:hypothetical protein